MANCTRRDDFFWERVETTSMENDSTQYLVWKTFCVCEYFSSYYPNCNLKHNYTENKIRKD